MDYNYNSLLSRVCVSFGLFSTVPLVCSVPCTPCLYPVARIKLLFVTIYKMDKNFFLDSSKIIFHSDHLQSRGHIVSEK